MKDSNVLFRRRVAIFATISVLIYVFGLIILRQAYQGTLESVAGQYGIAQSEITERTGAQATDILRQAGLRARQLAAAIQDNCAAQKGVCDKLLAEQLEIFAPQGALDIMILDSSGQAIGKTAEQDFFSRMQGWPREADVARDAALTADTPGAHFSPVFTFRDDQEKERPAMVIAVPLFLAPKPPAPEPKLDQDGEDNLLEEVPAETPPAPDEDARSTEEIFKTVKPARKENVGALAIPVSLVPLSERLQQWSQNRGARKLIVMDANKLILSHPDPTFIGAGATEVFSLATFKQLDRIIGDMAAGGAETAPYTYPAGGKDKSEIKWWMAYSPADAPGGKWALGITYPHKDIPQINAFFWKYFVAALLLLLLLVCGNVLPLMEFRRMLKVQDELVQLHDVNAINEILRNVNEELTQDKQHLDKRSSEILSLHEQNLELLEQAALKQMELFGTIKKPTPEQRELIIGLKRTLETLQRKPEGQFWKKGLDQENPEDKKE